MSIKIVDLAKTLGTHLLAALDSVAAPEKLHRIAVELNTKTPESARELMITLASKDELAKLFTDCTQLGDLLPALNGCCFLINQSLKRVFSSQSGRKSTAAIWMTSSAKLPPSCRACSATSSALPMVTNYSPSSTTKRRR